MLRLGLVIFLAAYLANASHPASDVSLFQRQVQVKSHSNAGACDCLNWKELYASKKVKCGAANEYFWLLKNFGEADFSPIRMMEDINDRNAVCEGFYERIDDNVCLNIDRGQFNDTQWNGGQWCYVSAECTNLNGGRSVYEKDKERDGGAFRKVDDPSDAKPRLHGPFMFAAEEYPVAVNWKVCNAKEDKTISNMEPPELYAWHNSMHMPYTSFNTLLEVAYPHINNEAKIDWMATRMDNPEFRGMRWNQTEEDKYVHELGLKAGNRTQFITEDRGLAEYREKKWVTMHGKSWRIQVICVPEFNDCWHDTGGKIWEFLEYKEQ